MEKPDIVVVGFNGNAMEMIEAIEAGHRIVAFLDDAPALQGTDFEGIPIQPIAALAQHPAARVVVMIGSERSFRSRGALIERLGVSTDRWASIIHPSAQISRLARIGHGVVLGAGVWIGSAARLGNHVVVLQNSIVSHDTEVGDFSLIAGNVTVAGGCRIGRSCYLGGGSTVRNGIEIGEGALVGMAANVLRPVSSGRVVVGNPARALGAPSDERSA